MRRTAIILVFLLLLPESLCATELIQGDDFTLGLKGYYKNLFFTSKQRQGGDFILGDVNRIRTEWDLRYTPVFSVKAIWDHEMILGDAVDTPEFSIRQDLREEPYLDLEWELARRDNFSYGQRLYRVYGKFETPPVTTIIGRQKIDWGVMRILSPVDLFTPLTTFDIERDEKTGSTAANLTLSVNPTLRVNPVYAFDPHIDRSRIGMRITQTVRRFDVSMLGGRFLQDAIVGFDFSGDLKGAGLRGELTYNHAHEGPDFVQLALGADYALKNTFYVNVEYFFNGQANNDPAPSDPFQPLFPTTANRIQSSHQHLVGIQMKYDITPIWTVMLLSVVDAYGGSVFVSPETKYSPFSWLDVSAGVQTPVGRAGGEFTELPNIYYFQTQMFF